MLVTMTMALAADRPPMNASSDSQDGPLASGDAEHVVVGVDAQLQALPGPEDYRDARC